ncbi:phage tail tube protein [Shinella zoogloeoides]|uniref:phage tail tube protein n=1 Tax=Shinella zoogloeoides TaxID=352475 RepID=UPI0028A9D089|nr:phage tail tube protein [Shinella zoogloeoides]
MGKKDFGGVIRMRLSTGDLIPLRGTLNMSTAGVSTEAVTNQDGSVDRTMTPTPRRAEITFADRGLDHDQIMKSDRFNVTFIEENTGVTHYFTRAFLVGEPMKNRITGEVTGISIAAEAYRKTEG